jgi:hypothetical protein
MAQTVTYFSAATSAEIIIDEESAEVSIEEV